MMRRLTVPVAKLGVPVRHFGFFNSLFGKKETAVEPTPPTEPTPVSTPTSASAASPSIPQFPTDPSAIDQAMKAMKEDPDAIKKAMATFEEAANGGGGVAGMILRNGPMKAMFEQAGGAENFARMLKDPSVVDKIQTAMKDPAKLKRATEMMTEMNKTYNTDDALKTYAAGAGVQAGTTDSSSTTPPSKPVTFSSRPPQKKKRK